MLQIPASHPQNLPFWPQTKHGQTSPVSPAAAAHRKCRGQALLWSSEGSEVATEHGGGSCAVQPACAFSCSALKYPLVSFLTSYSLYPKLCISPLNGVIFLIAGRALLLDTSLLLVHCVVLQRAPGTHLILQTARRESSCSSAASAHPKRSLLPIRLIAETPTPGRSWLGAALQPLYPTEE